MTKTQDCTQLIRTALLTLLTAKIGSTTTIDIRSVNLATFRALVYQVARESGMKVSISTKIQTGFAVVTLVGRWTKSYTATVVTDSTVIAFAHLINEGEMDEVTLPVSLDEINPDVSGSLGTLKLTRVNSKVTRLHK